MHDSTKKEEVETTIRKIEAMVLFVQDLAGCTAFYRDTFKLQYKGSDADSASFLLEDGLYLILLSPSGAADLPESWQAHPTDLDFLISQEAREIIEQEGIVLLSYKPLQQVWQERCSSTT